MKLYIIYKITNKLNGKTYIGLTHRGLELRINEHISESNKNKEKHFQFHFAIKKYGIENFSSEILEENIACLKEASRLEIFYIEQFNTYKKGYNMTKGGGGYHFKHTEATKQKMREAKLGYVPSIETRKKVSLALKGKPKSEEHKLKVKQAITGKKHSEERKKASSERMKGAFTDENGRSAITVEIFDQHQVLQFKCHGTFDKVCRNNGLPAKALRRSYYNDGKPIYSGKTIKKCVLSQNKEFIGWYAIKIDS